MPRSSVSASKASAGVECRGYVVTATFKNGLKDKRVGDGKDVSHFVRASGCAVDQLTGAVDLAQMPFR